MNKTIQVFGSGCPSCKKLFEQTVQAVEESQLHTEVEYVTDLEKLAELGVMSLPALVIDGKVVVFGKVPSVDELKQLLK